MSKRIEARFGVPYVITKPCFRPVRYPSGKAYQRSSIHLTVGDDREPSSLEDTLQNDLLENISYGLGLVWSDIQPLLHFNKIQDRKNSIPLICALGALGSSKNSPETWLITRTGDLESSRHTLSKLFDCTRLASPIQEHYCFAKTRPFYALVSTNQLRPILR